MQFLPPKFGAFLQYGALGNGLIGLGLGRPWPDDNCAPKGLCGLNAYYVKTNQSFGYNCLPGLTLINQSEMSSSYKKNFTAESCKASMTYTIEAGNNTIWEDKNISVLSLSTQEACKAACLQGCNCDAAQFKQGEQKVFL